MVEDADDDLLDILSLHILLIFNKKGAVTASHDSHLGNHRKFGQLNQKLGLSGIRIPADFWNRDLPELIPIPPEYSDS